jgi:pimeloyl-ACP methyl ester carboxylesterase
VRALQSPDRTIVAFDAKGNGDSPGRGTTALDYAAAVRTLGERYGGFDAIVAHSLGALASFIAVREGARADRIVSISGVYDANELIASFTRQTGLPARLHERLLRRIGRGYFPAVADPWRRVVAELQPTDTHIPVLLIHDEDDTQVDPRQLDLIADAHTGEVATLRTRGLRHSRILSDPRVLAAVTRFLGGEGGPPDHEHRHEESGREVEPEESLPAPVR